MLHDARCPLSLRSHFTSTLGASTQAASCWHGEAFGILLGSFNFTSTLAGSTQIVGYEECTGLLGRQLPHAMAPLQRLQKYRQGRRYHTIDAERTTGDRCQPLYVPLVLDNQTLPSIAKLDPIKGWQNTVQRLHSLRRLIGQTCFE
jgi:hypothetical protein